MVPREIRVLHLKNGNGDFICESPGCPERAYFIVQIPTDKVRKEEILYNLGAAIHAYCDGHYDVYQDIIKRAGIKRRTQEVG